MSSQFHTPGAVLPRAVLFDFGGTLDADGVTWKDRAARLILEEGIEPATGNRQPATGKVPAPGCRPLAEGEEFDRAFYRADDALVGKISRSLSLAETVRALFCNLSQACHWTDNTLAEKLARRFYDDSIAVLNHNSKLLDALASRYRLGVISNFYGNLETVCRELGLGNRLAIAIDSNVVGLEKPDPAIFHLAAKKMGIAPHEAVFVGDSLKRDMAGARAAGMAHIWLACDPAADAACCPHDRVIHRFDELAEILL